MNHNDIPWLDQDIFLEILPLEKFIVVKLECLAALRVLVLFSGYLRLLPDDRYL